MIQKGVVRTNCLDCLDRTNLTQAKIGFDILDNQLREVDIDLQSILGQSVQEYYEKPETNQTHVLIKSFKRIWSENADYISFHYAGTFAY